MIQPKMLVRLAGGGELGLAAHHIDRFWLSLGFLATQTMGFYVIFLDLWHLRCFNDVLVA